MTDAALTVVSTLDDEAGEYCVDIVKTAEGTFTYIEYARDVDDPEIVQRQVARHRPIPESPTNQQGG